MRILVTAGATWIKIDAVRILTSIFTGRTGLYLAKKFKSEGYKVRLLLNPHCLGEVKDLEIVPFYYFADLKRKVLGELKRTSYDVIIHSAAVSDYQLKNPFKAKIPSGKERLILELFPTEKIIKLIRGLAPQAYLVQFKLEIDSTGLVHKAYASLQENKSDLVVANSLSDLKISYKAYLIDKEKRIVKISSREELFYQLHKAICLWQRSF